MVNMDTLRKRYEEAKQADEARNTLLDDLFQKVNDLRKTMERNAFIMVLIDGDCMNFLNELVVQGIAGGDEAAKLLNRAVFEYLRYDEDFKHDYKIVIRVYANLRGLSKTYVDKGILQNTAAFSEFVLGFNKAHPLCEFIDAGNHKEAADTKLKENLSLYVHNVHCKQIIFGASADNGYASYLSSFFIDTDVSSRIRILKGPPFSFEFRSMITKFRWTEFKNVFRSDLISNEPVQHHSWRRSQELEQPPTHQPLASTTISNSAMPWRPKKNANLYATNVAVNETTTTISEGLSLSSEPKLGEVDQDSDGSGVDVSTELRYDQSPALSAASSVQPTLPRASGSPAAIDIEAALISSTNERLNESPKALDFAVVKQRVERSLGLTPDFWGRDEKDEWFLKSKNIIKMAVEDWVERTDNPPPKNATWMLRYFTSAQESPSAIMKNPSSMRWRTRRDLGFNTPSTNYSLPTGRAAFNRIYQNSKGQRIDIPKELHVDIDIIHGLRDREPRLCNSHHLVHGCAKESCPYDHDSMLSYLEIEALMYLSRGQRCPYGSACTFQKCIKGHMCPNGKNCRYGKECKFADLHGIDTVVAIQDTGS